LRRGLSYSGISEREWTQVMQCSFPAILLFLLCSGDVRPDNAADNIPAQRIVALSKKILNVFEGLEDFSCDVEIQYYRMAKEDKKYCFTLFRETPSVTRIRFSRPYPGLTATYKRGDTEVTIQPFLFIPFMKFKLSLYHSLLRTPSGQRMDQGSIEYLSRFFYNNINLIQQHESSFSEETDRVAFSFWAADYTGGKELNRYYVIVSKENWFPLRIERYNQNNVAIEVIIFKEFVVHAP